MRIVKAASLVLDFGLYPRSKVDLHHLSEMCEAERAGVEFPDVVVDGKSKRVVDGFHRVRKQLTVYGEGATISCRFKHYKSEREMFEEAMQLNASHGRNLSSFDKAHCILRAADFGISDEVVAAALSVTEERIELVRTTKVATVKNGDGTLLVPLKRTIGHKAGKRITVKQQAANQKLGGMAQLFYVNQIILLIESGLLDTENEKLMEKVKQLKLILP